ncbi:MAG: Hint domain-containing protein [Candidatus Woesearchaeota archaeon]
MAVVSEDIPKRCCMYEIVVGRSASDMKKFGTKGTILLGKHYIKMGRTTSLSNEIYLDMIRSHVVFICGKRGGGKCLAGDTLITLQNGAQCSIKDLENNDSAVFSLNSDLKIQQADKSDFFKRKVKSLLKVTLRSGKEIKLTPEHPLLTLSGWMPAERL